MSKRVVVTVVLGVSLAACGSWSRVGSPDNPQPATTVARLFDPGLQYRTMGFLAGGDPLPWVGAIRWLAGATPDSTLALVSLSFANHSLRFRRDGNDFMAAYRVELTFHGANGVPRTLTRDETVRVRSFQETLRADESVIFQQFMNVAPGPCTIGIVVRDRDAVGASRQEVVDTIPKFDGPALSSPIPVYEGAGRSRRDTVPALVTNPRATLPYGNDTLVFYLEGYNLAPGTRVLGVVEGSKGDTLWSDTVALSATTGLSHASIRVPPGKLPVGQERFRAQPVGGGPNVVAPFLVSFSSLWVVTNWEEMLSLLRFFPRQDLVAKLHSAPDSLRPQAWRDFWTASDPVTMTPENEALNAYLTRVQIASQRFTESADPGWLTDRGEVFITLGEPDEMYDLESDYSRTGVHGIRWVYTSLRLDLLFVDQTGFGRFRMTPGSRADFDRVATRLRHTN
ncbi:MAG TPA: GWxTD domain-containing protein [Gemmatimonadales bacterium]|nr:GWxTD domain-containing protein [Gemmatimonadales bacterium]